MNNSQSSELKELTDRIEVIERKLDLILLKLDGSVIKNCDKMGTHIDFVNSVYTTVKVPLNYISNKIIKDTTGVLKKDWTSDTDSIAIDPYILRLDATWRFLEMQGRAYAEKQRTANLAISERVKSNGSRTAIIHQGKVNQGVAVSTIKPIIYFNPLTTQYIF